MNKIKNSKILVIGGAGFIGSYVIEELLKEEPEKVIIYDNFVRGTRQNIAESLKNYPDKVEVFGIGGDIRDVDILNAAMEGVDYVIHLAALWIRHCHDFPRSALLTNIDGTFNVLEACVKHNIKKLVYSSSASVYGNAIFEPMTEDHPYNNTTFYGTTKIAGEHMCRAMHNRYGLDYIGLRYMNVYGPRQDYKGVYIDVIMRTLDNIQSGKPPIIFGDGTQSYDFIYVRDVARANIAALKSDKTDDFYNVGTGIKTSINELIEMVLEIADIKDIKIEHRDAGITFVTNRIGSTEKAEKDLDFKYIVPLREGLENLINWKASL